MIFSQFRSPSTIKVGCHVTGFILIIHHNALALFRKLFGTGAVRNIIQNTITLISRIDISKISAELQHIFNRSNVYSKSILILQCCLVLIRAFVIEISHSTINSTVRQASVGIVHYSHRKALLFHITLDIQSLIIRNQRIMIRLVHHIKVIIDAQPRLDFYRAFRTKVSTLVIICIGTVDTIL